MPPQTNTTYGIVLLSTLCGQRLTFDEARRSARENNSRDCGPSTLIIETTCDLKTGDYTYRFLNPSADLTTVRDYYVYYVNSSEQLVFDGKVNGEASARSRCHKLKEQGKESFYLDKHVKSFA